MLNKFLPRKSDQFLASVQLSRKFFYSAFPRKALLAHHTHTVAIARPRSRSTRTRRSHCLLRYSLTGHRIIEKYGNGPSSSPEGGERHSPCSTQVANAREKAKDSRARRKGRHADKTGSARGEDKNVDWPQIESHPFITLHLCPRPSAALSTPPVRYRCGQKSQRCSLTRSRLSSPAPSSLRPLAAVSPCFTPPSSPPSAESPPSPRGRESDSQNGWTEFLAERAIRTSS